MLTRLRTLWYKVKYQFIGRRAVFGKGTRITCKLDIRGPGRVSIGRDCILGANAWGSEYVTLYTHQPQSRIVIGDRVILRATRFGAHLAITVKDDAVLESASIYDSDFHNKDALHRDQNVHCTDRHVILGEASYVGVECLCSKGTVLSRQVTLLPGSVIGTKTIPDGAVVCGNPARILYRDGRVASGPAPHAVAELAN